MVSVGATHTAGITTAGILFTWGNNALFQGGLGDGSSRSSPTQIASTSWSTVSAGATHTAGITTAGASTGVLYTWGSNAFGNLGDGTTLDKNLPILINTSLKVSTANTIKSMRTTNSGAALILDNSNTLYTIGNNSNGELGIGSTTNSSSLNKIVSGIQNFSTANSYVAASLNGYLYMWGKNDQSQLTGALNGVVSTPTQIPYNNYTYNTDSWKIISASTTYTAAVRSDGGLFTWGQSVFGSLGDGGGPSRSSPVQVGTSSWTIVSVGGGWSHGILITGALFGWGSNNGAIGDNTGNTQYSPVQIGTSSWTIVSDGNFGAAAIRIDGALFTWGSNNLGQLGDGTVTLRSSPVQIGTSSWTKVSAGGAHVLGITTTGALYAWGSAATYGTLGDGTTVNKSSPVQIGTSSWSVVSAGNSHSAGILTTGALFTWGRNDFGQLGDGTTINKSSPVQVGTSSWTIVNIGVASNSNHTIGTLTTGALFAWGYNIQNQLGDGTTINKSSPVQIGTSSWAKVGAGGTHTGAITSTGTLYTWGYNGQGQLGNGLATSTNTTTPGLTVYTITPITNLTSPIVSLGFNTTLVSFYNTANNNYSIYGWGDNSKGQFGDGTTTNKYGLTTPSVSYTYTYNIVSGGNFTLKQ
jgi:alpha-tubulin suppressor-like RCC1 family protein